MAESKINIRALFDLKGFSTSAQNLERKMQKTASNLKKVGSQMSMAFTAPAIALGGLAIREFANFEQSMAKVAAVSGATTSELSKLTELAKQLGISTRYTSSEVSELQLNYAKLGFSSSEIEKITGATLSLALATGEDLANSAEIAGATLRGFQKPASEMQTVVDLMANSFSSSSLNLERFGTAMGYIAPVANAAGISLERSTAMMSTLSDAGIQASTVGTSLRQIFIQLATKGISYEDAMNRIRNATDKVVVANDLFGDRAFAAGIVLAEQGVKVDDLTDKYLNSGGSAKKMADIMDNTLQGSLFKLKSAVEGLAISFGEDLGPTINKVATFLSNAAMGFANLTPETKLLIIQMGLFAASIGPVLLGLGQLTKLLGWFAANPAIAALTAIGVAIAVINLAATESNKIFPNVQEQVDKMTDAYVKLGEQLEIINGLKSSGRKLTKDEIQATILQTKAIIKQTEAIIAQSVARYEAMLRQLETQMQATLAQTRGVGMQGEFIGADLAKVETIKKNIAALAETINQANGKLRETQIAFNTLETDLKNIQTVTAKGIGENTAKSIDEVTDSVKKLKFELSTLQENQLKKIKILFGYFKSNQKKQFEKDTDVSLNLQLQLPKSKLPSLDWIDEQAAVIKAKYTQIGSEISTALNDGLKTLAANGAILMGEFLGNVISGSGQSIEDFGKSFLNVVGMFMQDFGKAIIGIGVAKSALDAAITSGNAPLAIAAGIALVAAGTALSNISKKGLEGAGGGGAGGYSSPSGSMNRNNLDLQPIVLETKIQGRELILVQDRSRQFKR